MRVCSRTEQRSVPQNTTGVVSDLREAAAQVRDDGGRVVEPLAAPAGVGDLQAGHFDGTTALLQFAAVSGVVLGIALLDGQRQAPHFLAYFDAKRAGCELVERQVFALQVDGGLYGGLAHHAAGLGESLFDQHEGTEHSAQGFEEGADDGFHKGMAIKSAVGGDNGEISGR